ncbi:MAG: peptidylprolyl isomerase [Rhizobiaceae bacterium]
MYSKSRSLRRKATAVGSALVAALLVSACSQLSELTSTTAPATPIAPDQPKVTGAPEVGRIKGRGGTKIAVLVNKQPITTNQIQRRAAFVKLRRIKGNRTTIATNELVDEALQLQEARRIRVIASDADVNQAYARFARSNKLSVSRLDQVMAQSGVTKRGFKDFIRASMSWQRAVAARIQRQSSSSGGGVGSSGSPSWLPAKGTASGKATEYTIQQIVFIVPKAKRSSLLARRRNEAKRFRTQLNGCENARELAAVLKDVSVLDRGRLLESELPPRWAKAIKSTPAGKVTRVQDDAKGVEMIAVCKTREVIGTGSDIDANLLSGGGKKSPTSKVSKEYMAELKKRAIIQRR